MQTLGFLLVGTVISVLMHHYRAQQTALDGANQRLRQAAGTLESLTISRERNRMARELHDTLAHTLSGLIVQLATVNAYWEIDAELARTLLCAAEVTARQGLQDTRRALTTLRASPLEDLGLALALHALATAAAERAHLALELRLPAQVPLLAPEVEQGIYRVAQEALANVVYHARARRLGVTLVGDPPTLRLVIQDDGVGFDVHAPVSAGHFGLAGMHERGQWIGAQVRLQSAVGAGTTVELVLELGMREGEPA